MQNSSTNQSFTVYLEAAVLSLGYINVHTEDEKKERP